MKWLFGGEAPPARPSYAFRTAPNAPINRTTDDLGTLGGDTTEAGGINVSGQVVGWSWTSGNVYQHAFRESTQKLGAGWFKGTVSFGLRETFRILLQFPLPKTRDLCAFAFSQHQVSNGFHQTAESAARRRL